MSDATRLEQLRHALKEARDRMHRYAGRAFNLGLLDEREVREYRRLLKRGRIQTLPRSESPLQALVNEYEAVGDRYRALVEEAQVEPEVPRESAEPKREGAETRIQEIESWDEERMKDFVERHKVVQYMEQGFSSKEAVKRAGVSRSSSWARKWYARYGESGIAGLVDLRCFNGSDPSVLTHAHRRLILGARKARPAATVKSVFERVEKVCAARDITPPSYESVKKFLSHLCPAIRAALTENWDEMKKQHLPMKSVLRSKRPNERWQSDHSRLNIWVKVKSEGEWEAREVWFTPQLDTFSRTIPGYFLSCAYPDSWSIALSLRKAILPPGGDVEEPCGIPGILQVDQGSDFLSYHVEALCARLDIELDVNPPSYPNANGKIERFFRTLDEGLLRALPGHMAAVGTTKEAAQKRVDELLTLSQLRAEIDRWLAEHYHRTEHSALEDTPIEVWRRSVHLRLPESEEALNLLLLPESRPLQIRNQGLPFLLGRGGGHYHSDSPQWEIGRKVTVRYNPEDLDCVATYCAQSGELIGFAFREGSDQALSIGRIKKMRGQVTRGLKQRLSQYAAEVQEADRIKADTGNTLSVEDWEALARADEDDAEEESAEVEDLLAQYEAQFRPPSGESGD